MTLHVTGLSAIRGGRVILYPTDVSLPVGQCVGIVGSSGAGKSTLCQTLIERLRQDGISVAHVPQSPEEALDPLRTLAFHWRQAERALGLSHDRSRQVRLLNALELGQGKLNVRPWAWSRGMRQRFVIAMALLTHPDVLILDEPTSALDPLIAAATLDLVDQHLEGTKTTLLIVTHDLGLAAARAEQILVMDEGRVVETSATVQLLNNPKSPATKALVSHRSWAELPCSK